uniref:Uncharacterized protein n=1 Tax=Anguilla anguilla TaxID=7936 RepID=A0A0E9UG97_ANGAN
MGLKTHACINMYVNASNSTGTVIYLEPTVNTVAVCAGSGGSVLNAVKADLYITGSVSQQFCVCK